ncbi:MAG: ATP synthase F1 subunit gamma [Patescibacteria group bacterium]
MQSLRDIKKRIHSVKNIAQITKAMEVVSMTKMRRSQHFALAARPFALASLKMLGHILKKSSQKNVPLLLKSREIKKVLLVVITADKGLVGGFNDTVLDKADHILQKYNEKHTPVDIVVVGKKARDHFEHRHIHPIKSFIGFGDFTQFSETTEVAQSIVNGFHKNSWQAVEIIYTHFKTTLKQKTVHKQLLPASEESLTEFIQEIIPEYGKYSDIRDKSLPESHYNYTYTFEPSPEKIVVPLVENILKTALHHIMLESNASEHSARMVTMKSATDNASELKDTLTLEMNKARQAGITSEISEIIAGAEALS